MKELNEELLTKLVVTPDTVTAVVDAKTKTIQLVGYITEGEPITLNGEPITRSGSKFTLGNTVYRVVLNVTERPINVTLDEKRPEIAPAEDATDDTKKAAAAITSPSTTSDGLRRQRLTTSPKQPGSRRKLPAMQAHRSQRKSS